MSIRFAYSFDKETFFGNENTRQDALKLAIERARQYDAQPEVIYVGKRIPLDPGSSDLAELVIQTMRRRIAAQAGDGAQPALTVDEHQMAELDDQLDRVIRAWLAKHELLQNDSRIIAISEHPVPQPSMNADGGAAAELRMSLK